MSRGIYEFHGQQLYGDGREVSPRRSLTMPGPAEMCQCRHGKTWHYKGEGACEWNLIAINGVPVPNPCPCKQFKQIQIEKEPNHVR